MDSAIILFTLYLYSIMHSCYSDQQRQSDEQYRVHLNGGTSAPWPINTQDGKMFAVPTQLQVENEIIIKGTMTDGMLDIGLRPNGNQDNIVCQVNVNYSENGQPPNQIVVGTVHNGNNNTIEMGLATNYFSDSSFDIRFSMVPNGIRISVKDSYLDTIQLQHSMDDIRYISVRGEVKELSFMF